MSGFDATDARIRHTCERFNGFPRDAAVLVRLIKHIHAHVHDAANVVLRRYGLNHTDYNILMMIYGSADDAVNPSRLGSAAGEKAANITRICTALCEKGLIDRVADSGGDRRKVALSLTDSGRRCIESLLPAMAGMLDASVRGIDAAERAQLEGLLRRVLDNTERL
jgi:MarR family transcriptional repressor of emrRAB